MWGSNQQQQCAVIHTLRMKSVLDVYVFTPMLAKSVFHDEKTGKGDLGVIVTRGNPCCFDRFGSRSSCVFIPRHPCAFKFAGGA